MSKQTGNTRTRLFDRHDSKSAVVGALHSIVRTTEATMVAAEDQSSLVGKLSYRIDEQSKQAGIVIASADEVRTKTLEQWQLEGKVASVHTLAELESSGETYRRALAALKAVHSVAPVFRYEVSSTGSAFLYVGKPDSPKGVYPSEVKSRLTRIGSPLALTIVQALSDMNDDDWDNTVTLAAWAKVGETLETDYLARLDASISASDSPEALKPLFEEGFNLGFIRRPRQTLRSTTPKPVAQSSEAVGQE